MKEGTGGPREATVRRGLSNSVAIRELTTFHNTVEIALSTVCHIGKENYTNFSAKFKHTLYDLRPASILRFVAKWVVEDP